MTREIQSGDLRKRATAYFDIELDDAGLDPYAFRAYCRIARRAAGHDSGSCTESVENMAQGCQMSRPTMVRALADLLRRGMIQRVRRHGYTSVYVLLDKTQWKIAPESRLEVVKDAEGGGKPQIHPMVLTDPGGGKGEIHPLVNHRSNPGKPQIQGVVNHRSTKKTKEEYKKEKSIGADAPAPKTSPAKSPNHNHPAVNVYRVELGYKQVNSHQANLIAESVGGAVDVPCPAQWVTFLRELAVTGFKYAHNVRVVVLAYGHWCRGVSLGEAIHLAFEASKGNGAAGVAPVHVKRQVVV